MLFFIFSKREKIRRNMPRNCLNTFLLRYKWRKTRMTADFKIQHTAEKKRFKRGEKRGLGKQQIHWLCPTAYKEQHIWHAHRKSLNKLCFRGSGVMLSCRLFQVSFPQQDGDSARDKCFRPSQAAAPKQWTTGNLLTSMPSAPQTAHPGANQTPHCWKKELRDPDNYSLLQQLWYKHTGLLLNCNLRGFAGRKKIKTTGKTEQKEERTQGSNDKQAKIPMGTLSVWWCV